MPITVDNNGVSLCQEFKELCKKYVKEEITVATMKKLILLAFISLAIVGCISDSEEAKIYERGGFATLTYDSCEYVFKTAGYKGFLAHKGNCRFCKERRQKELEELVTNLRGK